MTPEQITKVETFPDLNARGVFSGGERVSRVLYWQQRVVVELVPTRPRREVQWFWILNDGGSGGALYGIPDDPERAGITLATVTAGGLVFRRHPVKKATRRGLKRIRRRKVSDALPF